MLIKLRDKMMPIQIFPLDWGKKSIIVMLFILMHMG
jgi:hypothetical protein